ncbi:DUF397 domain-containing protein [Nocardiopsis alkaliphila]|uniref:DUF397 domain-containing protein n=1 Tax=Nocardiopsis alkaliphila TaxID=225762 RepID=UPI00034DFABC|nr:DUF397 domain-containing protein [Nocardiopsis alkaliphila]
MTPERERTTIDWHISSYSDNGGATCVEVGALRDGSGRVAMRHSLHPESTHLVYTHQEWKAFTQGVRAGEFDF